MPDSSEPDDHDVAGPPTDQASEGASAPTSGDVAVSLSLARTLWLAATSIVAAVGVLVPLLGGDPSSTVPIALPATLVVVVGATAAGGALLIDQGLRSTPPADDRAAVAALTSRLVMQIAVLEAPALLGVALAFVLGPPWVATLAALPCLLALAVLRPGRGRFERLDAAWRDQGVDVSLVRAARPTSA